MPIHARRVRVAALALVLMLGVVACGSRSEGEGDASESATGEDTAEIAAFGPVAAIFETTCATAACHSAERGAGQLVLGPDVARGNLVNAPSNQQDGATLVIAGDPEGSYLMAKLRGDDGIRGSRMPIGRSPLAEEELAAIADWIAGGAGE